MIYPWKLKYWQTGEWQVCNERLKDMEKAGHVYNPKRSDLFRSLQQLKPEDVRVVIVGQDPYPDKEMATGLAFSIPDYIKAEDYPKTLQQIFKEYSSDTHYPDPPSGDLHKWADQGVLLWNAIPSCKANASLSHDWDEYSFLTREVLEVLSNTGGIVFVFLGSVAKRYIDCVDVTKSSVVTTSHPSPRGGSNSRNPFIGSRIFTTINDKLVDLGRQPINWRLDDAEGNRGVGQEGSSRADLDRSRTP